MEYEPEALFSKVHFWEVDTAAEQLEGADIVQAQNPGMASVSPSPAIGCTSMKHCSDANLENCNQQAADLSLQEKPPHGLTSILASEIPLTASQKKNKRQSLFAKAIQSYKWLIGIVSKKLSYKISNTVTERAEVPHNDFIKRPKSQKKVVNWAQQVGKEEIIDFPPKGDIFLTPHETFPSSTDDPQYLLMRWDGVISISLNEEIWQLWEEFKTSDYKTAKKSGISIMTQHQLFMQEYGPIIPKGCTLSGTPVQHMGSRLSTICFKSLVTL
ncbi:hypothetical protein M422DRAFT_49269 [Sphaerobolus stellatus SS14]|uniref:Unplaced genomic scaffold SPHSTscaffold_70, whole genome shotgun sequence n=1 Tax=Sphaerobolus stellatus (strain SS14) TaxID=990650 RepID=A0A0C9VQ82_SPHS4|nr:hypothetical protein M422DRAFT_49269 [Sphaerobolus stellatus SS14]